MRFSLRRFRPWDESFGPLEPNCLSCHFQKRAGNSFFRKKSALLRVAPEDESTSKAFPRSQQLSPLLAPKWRPCVLAPMDSAEDLKNELPRSILLCTLRLFLCVKSPGAREFYHAFGPLPAVFRERSIWPFVPDHLSSSFQTAFA